MANTSIKKTEESAPPRSRRELLKLAGATLAGAAAGAAGAAALQPITASATQGSSVLAGLDNTETGTTTITNTSATVGSTAFSARHNVTTGNALNGITAVGNNNGGFGIYATTYTGIGGWFYSYTGVDVMVGKTFGLGALGYGGRISQVGRNDTGNAAPYFNASAKFFETIRGTGGQIWASRASGAGKASWKRINSVRVDSAANDGNPFVPSRAVNTWSAIGPVVGGVTGPLTGGATYTFTIAGTNGIPAGAVGFVGNITAANYTSGGFLTMFPAGTTKPVVSSVNFAGTFTAWGNHFTTGFGTGGNAGKVSVFVGLNSVSDTCQLIIDVFGYIE